MIARLAATAAVLLIAASCTENDQRTTTRESPAPRATTTATGELAIEEFPITEGAHPHDVAPAPDGTVWYTGQANGTLGRLDPKDGSVDEIPLGDGAAPHGVIVGPDDAAWVTDQGLNAIVRVDPETERVRTFPLPDDRPNGAPHTAVFDAQGVLWFTGSGGVIGRLDPDEGDVSVFDAPGGAGPYGITSTPDGDVYFASLQQSYIARIDKAKASAVRIEPPTKGQGARRVWSDSDGRIWVTYWNADKLARYDPETDDWQEWDMPGDSQPYAVFVDEDDIVWISDFGANALVRFDPDTEKFTNLELPASPGEVRQILGRPGEVWGAESAADALVVVRT